MKRLALTLAATACLLAFPAGAVQDNQNPEPTTRSNAPREAVQAADYMVSAANPLAVQAGVDVLAKGGNAVDAAIATQMALNVVEPQSSGIGGGGFMLYFDAASKKLHVYDGRETAPKAANAKLFLDDAGQPLPHMEAVQGGRSVGTPGLVKMLALAHGKHGTLEWSGLFDHAIQLAGNGFPLSPRLHTLLDTFPHVHDFPQSVAPYVTADGTLKKVGETVINLPMADALGIIAINGADAFYHGALADEIVAAVRQSPIAPGLLTKDDFTAYEAKEREPACAPYRIYTICSMPPPSSGGVTIVQALAILNALPQDLAGMDALSVDAIHLVAEASKLAYADRNHYLADPDFVEVPTQAMLDADYLAKRASLMDDNRATDTAPPGNPVTGEAVLDVPATEAGQEPPSTTHISVVDAKGNAVSMTTSIEYGFGSGLSAHGFLLNNQLTDFSFSPTLPDGSPHPNRVEAGKRPRSSMSPTMVFDENGDLLLVTGSPGGARIITYVLQHLIAVLDWKMDVQTAISLPHYLNMNGATELEADTELESRAAELEARGHEVRIQQTPSGIHSIHILPDGTLSGGADPRREGIAQGGAL